MLVTDHLGNTYISIRDMCKHYNLTDVSFRHRLSRGWSLEESLLGKKPLIDDEGTLFKSKRDFCKYYNIRLRYLTRFLSKGMSCAEISKRIKSKKIDIRPLNFNIKDENGNIINFMGRNEFCNYFKLGLHYFKGKLDENNQLILKDVIYDYQNNIYTTGRAFCKAKKMPYNRYYHLITKGITPYQISIWLDDPNDDRIASVRWMFEATTSNSELKRLEAPLYYRNKLYASYADLCRQLGVNYLTFCKRKEREFTFEECLYGKTKKVKEPKINKHEVTFDGKTFKTLKELCQYYNFNDSAVRSRLHRGFPLDEVVTYYLLKNK